MKNLFRLIAISSLNILATSCVNIHQIDYEKIDNKQIVLQDEQRKSISNQNLLTNNSFDLRKHYIEANVKYYDYKKYDDQGQLLSVQASGVAGRFAWENNCLVFISAYGGARATPLLPYGITQWNSNNKTLVIDNTTIKMGDLIEANGVFTETSLNREGVCWDYPYVVGIGVMGGIQVLKSEKELIF